MESMRPKPFLILILSVLSAIAAQQESRFSLEEETRWKAQTEAGHQAYQQGRFLEAEQFLAAAVREAERFGPQDPRLGASLYSLALLYQAQGKYAEAEPLYQRALAIVEKAVGPEAPVTAMVVDGLAGVHFDQGAYDRAEPLFRRALTIAESTMGPEAPDVATDLKKLAPLYCAQGRYAEADTPFRR